MSQRTVTDLILGEIYYFKVRGKAGDNFGPWSATLVELASVGDTVITTPDAPVVQGQILHLVATWNNLGGLISTYEVHIKPITDSDYTPYVDPDNPGWAPRYGAPSPAQNTFYGATASTFASIDRYFNQVSQAWEPLKSGVTYAIKIIAVARETLTPGGPANKSDPSPEGFGQIKVVSAGDGADPPDPTQGPVVEGHIGYFTVDMKDYGAVPPDFLGFEVFYATSPDGLTWSIWTTLGNQGTLIIHGPLDYTLQYKYRYRVTDVEDRFSGYSDETIAGFPHQAGEGDIIAKSLSAEILVSDVILGERLIATDTSGHDRVELRGNASSGIGLYNIKGDGTKDTETTVSIPVDGSAKFSGIIEANQGLTVSGKTTFTSSDMVMSSGSELLLSSHTPDPTNPPSLQKTWAQTPIPTSNHAKRGVNYDLSSGYYYMGDGDGNTLWEIDAAGNAIRSKKITPQFYPGGLGVPNNQKVWGAARNGTDLWLLCQSSSGSSTFLRRFDVGTLALTGTVDITNFVRGDNIGGFCFDSANNQLLVSEKSVSNVFEAYLVHIFSFNFNIFALNGQSAPHSGYTGVVTELDAHAAGGFSDQTHYDMQVAEGFWWMMISYPGGDLVYKLKTDGTMTTLMENRAFPYQGASIRGLAHDGQVFQSFAGDKIFTHTTWDIYNPTTKNDVFIRYSWLATGGSGESAATTVSNSTRTPRRQQLVITTPDFPPDVSAIRAFAYVGNGDADPSLYEAQSDEAFQSGLLLNDSPDKFFTLNIFNTGDIHKPLLVSDILPEANPNPSVIKSSNWELNSNDAFRPTVKGPGIAPNQGTPYSIGPLTDDTDGGMTYNSEDLAFYGMSNGIYTFLQPIMTFNYSYGSIGSLTNTEVAMVRPIGLSPGSAGARNWGIVMPWSGSVIALSFIAGGSLGVAGVVTYKVAKNGVNISGCIIQNGNGASAGSTRFHPALYTFAQDDIIKGVINCNGSQNNVDTELMIWVLRNG